MFSPKHSQCLHYKNGFCDFFGVKVDPDAPACPNFTPKAKTSKEAYVPKETRTPALQHPIPPPYPTFQPWLMIPPFLPPFWLYWQYNPYGYYPFPWIMQYLYYPWFWML